ELAIGSAGGQDHGAGGDVREVGEANVDAIPLAPQAGHLLHEGKAGSEDPALLVSLLGQPAPADSAGEAEVVADQRAEGRLPADSTLVDDKGAKPFGSAVDGSREPRRAGADDEQVEVAPLWVNRPTRRDRQL